MSNDDINAIIDLINEVDDADALGRIERAARDRAILRGAGESKPLSHRAAARRARNLPNSDGHKVGDVVRFNNRTSNYLAGLPVKVVGTNRESVNVEVPNDARYRRFAGGMAVRCPNTIIESTKEV